MYVFGVVDVVVDLMLLLICGRFQFSYRKSANVCGKKTVRKSANQNLESAICGFADRFAEVPSTGVYLHFSKNWF